MGSRSEKKLEKHHLAFLDQEALHLRLQQLKNERGYYNLSVSRAAVENLLTDPHWYSLFIPPEKLNASRFDKVRVWQQIAETLLCGYCERLYKFRKQAWESEHAKVYDLTPDDPNFVKEYIFQIDRSETELIEQIEDLSATGRSGKLFSYRGQLRRARMCCFRRMNRRPTSGSYSNSC